MLNGRLTTSGINGSGSVKITATLSVWLTLGALALPLAAIARAASYYSFQSPSGNIQCGVGTLENAFAICEIRDHTWVAPPRPTPCEGGWGDRISMDQGSAPALACHTDTVKGTGYPTLQYGQTYSVDAITCDSETSGITCTDNGTGHYFRLANDDYELH